MSVTPPRSGPSVTVVIVIASALLLVMAGVIIALAIALTAAPRPTQSQSDDDDNEPELSEIVLDASLAGGGSLDDDDLVLAEDIITTRLDAIGVSVADFTVDDDQIHLTFDDDVDEDTLDLAADALAVTFSADFRPVLEGGYLCNDQQDHTDYGPDEQIILCDDEAFEAMTLGPSEVSGQTIIGASVAKQHSGDYWGVTIVFNATGANALATMTQRLVAEPEGQNRLAIVLDGAVLASPTVTESIANGEVGISGSFDEDEAEALAQQLRFASKGLELSVDSTDFVKR